MLAVRAALSLSVRPDDHGATGDADGRGYGELWLPRWVGCRASGLAEGRALPHLPSDAERGACSGWWGATQPQESIDRRFRTHRSAGCRWHATPTRWHRFRDLSSPHLPVIRAKYFLLA